MTGRPISISLLMPCRNPGAYLGECLDSALAELGERDELVVQDCCSTDGSAEYLDRAAERDSRIRVRHEPDAGQSDALNRALSRARGDLIGWLNADDVLMAGCLPAVREVVGEHGELPDLVIGGWRLIRGDGSLIRQYPAAPLRRDKLLLWGCYAFSGAVLIRRDLLWTVGGFNATLHCVMDFDLQLRLAAAARTQLLVRRPVAAVRFHAATKSAQLSPRFVLEGLRVRGWHLHGLREGLLVLVGLCLHIVAIGTRRLRHSRAYGALCNQRRW
jgi:glycosyltransferase involved in cell wall biosynthesis